MVLTREAEAISALATVRAIDKLCSACGMESTDDSRFCRRCGTKMVVESSELEILRMFSEIRAGHTSIVSTFVASLASTAFLGAGLVGLLLAGITFGKGVATLLIIGLAVAILSNIFIGFGWNRVNRALKRKASGSDVELTPNIPVEIPAKSVGFLEDRPPASVTERTTNLLDVAVNPAKTGEY